MSELLVGHVVGYMLMISRKKGFDKIKEPYESLFKAIRHGDYDDFVAQGNYQKPPMVVSNIVTGKFLVGDEITQSNSGDFAGILFSSSGLKKLYLKLYNIHGNIEDKEIPRECYNYLGEFELTLRNYANIHKLISEREKLIDVINKVSSHVGMSDNEIRTLHQTRTFLNHLKHPEVRISTVQNEVKNVILTKEIMQSYDLLLL